LDYDGRRLTDLDSNEFIPRKKMDVSKRSLAVRGRLRTAVGFLVVLCAAGAVWMGARAQAQSKANPTATVKKLMPRPAEACCGYNFPRETDAELADGDVHRVHYEDKHIMLLEVSNPPLLHVKMHGHPFTSVFANDSTTGAHNPEAPDVPADQINRTIDPKSDYNDMGGTRAAPPAGMMWPACTPAAPQAPHEGPFNTGPCPQPFLSAGISEDGGRRFPITLERMVSGDLRAGEDSGRPAGVCDAITEVLRSVALSPQLRRDLRGAEQFQAAV
jgi:hypothetical protein